MITKILAKFKAFFFHYEGKLQSFTYYIPAPPERKTGYREKEFDKIFYEFTNRGYEILSFKTQSHQSEKQCGMWIIITMRATRPEADTLDLTFPESKVQDSDSIIDKLENISHGDYIEDMENVTRYDDL